MAEHSIAATVTIAYTVEVSKGPSTSWVFLLVFFWVYVLCVLNLAILNNSNLACTDFSF